MLIAALLLAASPCQGHQLADQHMDRAGDPSKPSPAFPTTATVQFHGASAVVTGIVGDKRWIDVYRFEGGAWHAFLSVDQQLPR